MKPAALLALLAAAAGVLALALTLLPRSAPAPVQLLSSQQCLDCHAQTAAEWRASHHAFAYENPEVRKLSQDFRNEECVACHAPRPVLDFAPGERVLARAAERHLGVDCLACHALPGGATGVATANPAPSGAAPCRPRTVPRLAEVSHCASCHNQHGTIDQWQAAPERLDGKPLRGDNCLHCHMPETWRPGGARGRDHSFRASHHLPSLQAAVTLAGGWDQSGPWVSVRNHGAAHNFPTDERSRAADVQVRWLRAEEWSEWQHVWRLRDPYRDEADLTNTQLPAGETWRQALAAPDLATAGEVRLLYRTQPFLPDEESAELARLRIEP